MKITPVLFVEAIEKSLPFWIGRLGFEKTVEVPDGDRLGFVILQKGAAELMIQTRESARKDVPQMGEFASAAIYVEVADFADLLECVQGVEVLLPVRETLYGMREIIVREPGGNAVCFAARI